MLFIIAFLLINPVAKKGDIIVKAEYIITMSWPADSHDDIDLYLKDPADHFVYFRQTDKGLNNLDRDDLGTSNDVVSTVSGDIFFRLNEEHITIREVLPGQYIVNAHWYSKSKIQKRLPTGELYQPSESVPVTVKIEKLNPYKLIYVGTKTLNFQGDEKTFLRFTVDVDGNVVETSDLPFKMADNTDGR